MFAHLAMLHDVNVIGKLLHDRQVMGDEDHGHAAFLLQVADEIEDLRLHRHIQRGGRFIGNQHVRIVGERHGDHHTLSLAAGKLVRILFQPCFRLRYLHLPQKIERPRLRFLAAEF
ncbi:hypothetical protein D3C78_1324480 [compost metagenome]